MKTVLTILIFLLSNSFLGKMYFLGNLFDVFKSGGFSLENMNSTVLISFVINLIIMTWIFRLKVSLIIWFLKVTKLDRVLRNITIAIKIVWHNYKNKQIV